MVKKAVKSTSSIKMRAASIRKKQGTTKAPAKIIKKTLSLAPVPKLVHHKQTSSNIDRQLADNCIALQKVMVNRSTKCDNLTTQISKLLSLFEISAKSLAEKGNIIGATDPKISDKLDNLFEQNRVIARGLTLMNNHMAGEVIQRREIPPIERAREMPSLPKLPKQRMNIPQRQIPPTQPNINSGTHPSNQPPEKPQFKKLPNQTRNDQDNPYA